MLSTHGAFSQVLNMEVELSWYEQPSRRSHLEKSVFSRPLRNANKHEGHFTGSLTGNAATSRQTKRWRPPNYFYTNNWTSTCFLQPLRVPKMCRFSVHALERKPPKNTFIFLQFVFSAPLFFCLDRNSRVLLQVFSRLAVRAWSAWPVARNFPMDTIFLQLILSRDFKPHCAFDLKTNPRSL